MTPQRKRNEDYQLPIRDRGRTSLTALWAAQYWGAYNTLTGPTEKKRLQSSIEKLAAYSAYIRLSKWLQDEIALWVQTPDDCYEWMELNQPHRRQITNEVFLSVTDIETRKATSHQMGGLAWWHESTLDLYCRDVDDENSSPFATERGLQFRGLYVDARDIDDISRARWKHLYWPISKQPASIEEVEQYVFSDNSWTKQELSQDDSLQARRLRAVEKEVKKLKVKPDQYLSMRHEVKSMLREELLKLDEFHRNGDRNQGEIRKDAFNQWWSKQKTFKCLDNKNKSTK